MTAVPADRSILVLAPHPDDEVVGFSALIGRSLAVGARVAVLFLTDGIPAADVLWPWQRARRAQWVVRRRDEARAACALLGAEVAGFLDIPTRRLKECLSAATAAVQAEISRRGVDDVWVPAYEGGHQDHDVASALASCLGVRVFEAPLYNFAGGVVRSQIFPDGDDSGTVTLTADEQAAKRRLLAVYASEQGNLDYVATGREALRPQRRYDYTQPPHPGKTFYQRFQWVPFRHPRVDFTRPEEVCRALVSFLPAP